MKKKNKKQKYNLGYEKNTDPFKAINAGFQFFGIDAFKDFVTDVLLYSTKQGVYDKENIPNKIDLRKCIKDFIFLCHHIDSCKIKKSSYQITDRAVIKTHNREPKNYIDCWQNKILLLNEEECKNPYLVFTNVFAKCNPKVLYIDFINAISFSSVDNTEDTIFDFNYLELYIAIISLIEACFLIYSYEILPINYAIGLRPDSSFK